MEQIGPELLSELTHLPADGAWREIQLGGGLADAYRAAVSKATRAASDGSWVRFRTL